MIDVYQNHRGKLTLEQQHLYIQATSVSNSISSCLLTSFQKAWLVLLISNAALLAKSQYLHSPHT